MSFVHVLNNSINLNNIVASGDLKSKIKESYIVGEPDNYKFALIVAKNGTIVLHDVENEMLYSNKNIVINNNEINFE